MEITKEQIKTGLNKAYEDAGQNAYFGNGFKAGVAFTLRQVKNTVDLTDVVKRLELMTKQRDRRDEIITDLQTRLEKHEGTVL